VVRKGHPPVSAIAANRIQLPEVPLVENPTLKDSHCLNIAFSVNSIGFLNRIAQVVFVFRQFVLAESDTLGFRFGASRDARVLSLLGLILPSGLDRQL
jgi:hypothetical protein